MWKFLPVKHQLFLSCLKETRFSKRAQISNFFKIRLVGAELFHADGQKDMNKLVVAFCTVAKARVNKDERALSDQAAF
jgi:hypothetical protein